MNQEKNEKQFDALVKKALRNERNRFLKKFWNELSTTLQFSTVDESVVRYLPYTMDPDPSVFGIPFTLFEHTYHVFCIPLSEALQQLPSLQRDTIFLLYFEQLTTTAAAKLLHKDPSSVSRYKQKALRNLQLFLQKKGE